MGPAIAGPSFLRQGRRPDAVGGLPVAVDLPVPVPGSTGIAFASKALVVNGLAKGYDFFTHYFTLVVTPMAFLSGVYIPIDQMPCRAGADRRRSFS